MANHLLLVLSPVRLYNVTDTDMINSLILAARRGVDVRIVVPGIPDKKIVYDLTSSYFCTIIL